MRKPSKKPRPSVPGSAKPGDHPSKINKRITGLSFVRDMGHDRFGEDPRREVQFMMVLAVPDDIKLPDHVQIVVTGDLDFDTSGKPVIRLDLHPHLVLDTLQPTEDELNFDGGDYAKYIRKQIPVMRIDQILTTLKWGA